MHRQLRIVALCGASGGAMIAAGSLQPWFSLFAGLQPYSGIVGLYGRVLLGVGLLLVALGALFMWKARAMTGAQAATLMGGIGAVTTAFAVWIAYGLHLKMTELEASPMLVAQLGPGVPMVLLGAMLVTASALMSGPLARTMSR